MKTIYKYTLSESGGVIETYQNSQVLSVQIQNNKLTLWILVDTTQKKHRKLFNVFETGHPLSDNIESHVYLATIQIGSLVWHIFELP